MTEVALIERRGEPRVDSRLIARQLGNRHRDTRELIERYKDELREFGVVPFQTDKPVGPKGGRPERYALLNEDQAFALLSLSRNTKRVVQMKMALIKAFSEARKAAELHQEYLPAYHALQEQIHALPGGTERHMHINMARLVNKAAGINAGERGHANAPSKGMLIAAQSIATAAMQGAADRKEAYARAKAALEPLLQLQVQP